MTTTATKPTKTDDFDFSIADGTNQDYLDTYPRIQWQHGKRQFSKLGDIASHTGGLFLPADQFPNFAADGWKEDSFDSSKNEEIKGYSTTKGYLAILRVKTWWNEYEDGKKSSTTNFLCCVKGVEGLFNLSVGGISKGKPMLDAFTAHRNQIVAMVNRTKPQGANGFEPYAMWFVVEPGPHETQSSKADATKGSEVTKPRLFLPEAINLEYARTLWVGAENYKDFCQLYKDTELWQTQIPKNQVSDEHTSDAPAFTGGDLLNESQATQIAELLGVKNVDEEAFKEIVMTATDSATSNYKNLTREEARTVIDTLKVL